MATKVVTFRLPDDLMEAITSQAQATGRPRTAIVVDALKQVFGVSSPQTLPASVEKFHQRQEAIGQAVASLKQQPVELRQGTASYSNQGSQEKFERSIAAGQSLFDEVSSTQPKVSYPQEGSVVVDVSGGSGGVNPELEPHSGIQDEYEETVQQLAAKVEQRARMLEQVLSASVDHVCMYDRLGRYTYANRAFMQSFQLERTDLYGKTWQQVGLPAEPMRAFDAKLQITLATGQSIAEEISLPTVNGVRDYEYILSPIHGTDGSIESVVYTARDITERKLSEEALRESEKNYRNLFEWAHDSIFITDSSTHILLDVNEHAARRLGYTRKQLLALPAEEYSPPMEAKDRESVLRQLWQTGHVVFEHVHSCKNGKQMPVEISSRVIEYGGQLAIQSFVRDITVRKQAEEELSLYRQIVASAKEAIAILDLQGRYVQQNPAHRSLLGYSDEALLGRTASYHCEPEGFTRLIKELLDKGSYSGEIKSRTNSGELVTLAVDAFVLRDESGKPAWYLLIPRVKPASQSID